MDKIRTAAGGKRTGKTKGHVTPFDMIPLGQKTGETSKSKLLAAASKPESSSSATSYLTKKSQHASPVSQSKSDDIGVECRPTELYDNIMAEGEDSDRTDKLLCGALKQLNSHRAKPNQHIVLTLMLLVKERPLLFTTDVVTSALCSLLKRDPSVNFKAKGNAIVTVLACNLLYSAYAEEEHWPQQFVEIYLDDSLGERVWVDRTDCKPFVDNIITAFSTKFTARNPTMLDSLAYNVPGSTSGTASSSSPCHSPFHLVSSDTGEDSSVGGALGLSNLLVTPRYKFQLDSIEQLVMDTITEQMTKRQQHNIEITSKQLLRLLTSVSGYCAVRLLVVTKLEIWLQNPKLMRVAQDLLLSVCLNCSGKDPNDKDVIVALLKIRLKNKQIISHYLACIRELLETEEENLRIAMTHTIYNELSAARNQNNMQILSIMFQQDSDRAPKLLADIYLDLLTNKEDYLRSLRILLREIVRTFRHDFTFHAFCVGLMGDHTTHPMFQRLDLAMKERVLFAITDLVAVCELLTISPAVREASATNLSWGDKRKDVTVMQTFWTQIAKIQRDAVNWLYEGFITMLPNIESQSFIQCLYKLVMMAQSDHYSKVDNWPAEADRSIMLRLASETPVLEDTIIRILMMGMEAEYPLKASDALDVMELMINRAAALNSNNYPALVIENLDLVKLLLAVSVYYHPDNIILPAGYNPPHLAILSMYWKSWLLMLIIAAFNPSTFAKHIWKQYPTLEMMMEMVMTNIYTFPPVTSGNDLERINAQERQISELEKQEILEFEGHLAAATSKVPITESNSLLLSELISMNATGPARRMSAKVVLDLKHLNTSLHLGHMLSKSRNPDFLLQVIQKQGTSEAMPWLSELVESSEGSLDVLPIQCLCEFLLTSSDSNKTDEHKAKPAQKIARYDRLLHRLQTIIQQTNDSDSENAAIAVIEYFFERLYSTSAATRNLSIKAMRAMFVDAVTQQAMDIDIDTQVDEFEWLLVNIADIKLFNVVEKFVQESLQKALFVEMKTDVVAAYITYLLESKVYRKEPSETMLELSRMLCCRPALCRKLLSDKTSCKMLLTAYFNFMVDAVTRSSAYEWADQSHSVMVQWHSGQVVVLDIRIIHAMMELVSVSNLTDYDSGKSLLDQWFPADGNLPVGCMSSNSELADLFTDNLRRTMLQSGNERLTTAALSDVKMKQLLSFFQLFGLPVSSVSAILCLLDGCCEKDPKAMKKSIQSQKSYLSQLLDTQRLRGAKGGDVLAGFLEKGASQAMETEPIKPERGRGTAPTRTLSTLESRPVELMASDTDRFVQTKLCQVGSSKEGLMTAQRSVAADSSLVPKLCQSLHTALSGPQQSALLDSFRSSAGLAAALLRLLACVPSGQDLSQDIKQLFEALNSRPSLPAVIQSVVQGVCSRLALSDAAIIDAENQFNQQMIRLCLANQRKEAVDICIERALLIQKGTESKTSLGLIIDWLELIDPEIDSLSSDLQDKLLFGSSAVEVDGAQSKAALAGPAYLRSLLTHHTRWSTIRQTIHRLLSTERVNQWSPTAVLDFLVVCISHPRLYQGREQKKPRNAKEEDVLCLTVEQMQSVAHLVCLEAIQVTGQQEAATATPQGARVSLLLKCCIEESELKSLVEYLEIKSTKSSAECVCYRRLLVLLYTQQPKLIHWLGDSSIFYKDMSLALEGPCTLDPEVHAALTTLASVKAGKKYVVSSSDANLVCRKLASHHPLLFLRHVSTLSSILSGRSKFAYGEFVHQNYLILHTNVLGLVELLQPHIYLHKHFPAIVDAFFTVIKIHGGENDDTLTALFIKFVSILCNFFNCLPDLCLRTITQYKELLSVLHNNPKYNKNPSLKTLATASYMPQAKESVSSTDLASTFILAAPPENITFTNEQLKTTLRKLNRTSPSEDIISALDDLDATSKKVIEVLSRCLDDFKHLILSLNQQIRDSAYRLIKRYLRHNPRVAGDFLTPVVLCLDHENADISNAALTHVADLALLMAEGDRKKLLDSAFSVAALRNSTHSMKSIQEIIKVVSTNVFAQQT